MNDYIKEITQLKEEIANINKKIEKLERKINSSSRKKNQILNSNANEFYEYLKEEGLNEHTIKNYFGVLRSLKRDMNNYLHLNITNDIYDIEDKEFILELSIQFKNSNELQEINKRQHNSYSAALNNYINFLRKKFTKTSFEFDE